VSKKRWVSLGWRGEAEGYGRERESVIDQQRPSTVSGGQLMARRRAARRAGRWKCRRGGGEQSPERVDGENRGRDNAAGRGFFFGGFLSFPTSGGNSSAERAPPPRQYPPPLSSPHGSGPYYLSPSRPQWRSCLPPRSFQKALFAFVSQDRSIRPTSTPVSSRRILLPIRSLGSY
jgi:hypothetical protein